MYVFPVKTMFLSMVFHFASRIRVHFSFRFFPRLSSFHALDFVCFPLGISYLPDGVVGSQPDPLRDGTVLLLGFGKLLLGAEGLVAL
jgi:hypothetical protein